MKAFVITLFLMTEMGVALASGASNSVLQELDSERLSLKSNSVAWTAWNDTTDKIFHEHDTSRWSRSIVGPPPADLKPAKLPLAFLVWRFQGERTNASRFSVFLDAIADSADTRHIEALLELGGAERPNPDSVWTSVLVRGATPEWAFQQIREAIATNAVINYYSLPFKLLDRFAAELPGELRRPAYDQIIRAWPNEPFTNHKSEGSIDDYYDVLLRIDRERARRQLIEQWPELGSSFNSILMLDKYAGPSHMVAEAARKWLAEASPRDKEIYGKYLEHLLLFSDPDTELSRTLSKIRELLRTQTKPGRGDELDALTGAVLELNLPSTADDLADFATQPAIPDITRFEILDWLVKRRYPGLPKIFAWWLREERYGKNWLRNDAEQMWGNYGRELLAEGDRLNELSEKK